MTKEELQKKVAPKLVRKTLSQAAIIDQAHRALDAAKYFDIAGLDKERINHGTDTMAIV